MNTRRGFLGNVVKLPLFVAVGSALTTSACWLTGSLFNQIMTYVNVGLQAFEAVVALLDPALAAASAVAIAAVKAGFADLQTAVNDYDAAPAADKTTLKNKIAVVLQDLQFEIQNFWNGLNLPSPLGTIVEGLLTIILSTLAGFAGQLPTPIPAPAGKQLAKTITVTPKTRSKKQFEDDFNAALTAAGKPAVRFH